MRCCAKRYSALFNPIEPLEDRDSPESLPQAIASAMKSRVHITYSTPLAARLDDLAVEENAIPGLDSLTRPEHALSDPPVGFLDDGDDSVANSGTR